MNLVLQAVSKHYRRSLALDNISFAVEAPGIVGLLGPNGAGKSTLLKIITGHLNPTTGSIHFDQFVNTTTSYGIMSSIGYLPEQYAIDGNLYPKEYLVYVACLHGLPEIQSELCVQQLITQLGLQAECKKMIKALSKGTKQRLALAAALVHDPSLVILDEPASGLDPNQLHDMMNLARQLGATKRIILSSHNLAEVESICDRVIILNRGTLHADIDFTSSQSSISDRNAQLRQHFDALRFA